MIGVGNVIGVGDLIGVDNAFGAFRCMIYIQYTHQLFCERLS